MMSADPFVPDPMNGQAWNRYSYVINNPLALTDTNGYCFLGMCTWGKAISTFFNRTIGAVFRAVPILGSLLQIAATALCMTSQVCAPLAAVVAGLTTSFVAGVTSGSLSYALKAGLVAGITAQAMYTVGGLTNVVAGAPFNAAHISLQFGTDPYWFNIAGHALVGCASAAASGGKCGAGALAGGITSAAGPWTNSKEFSVRSLVSNTVLGGIASVAGGGKFANGAITGAFGYLFNEMGGDKQRGYDATTYSDGTVCNAGTATGCIMEGARPSSLLEDAALLLSGVGVVARGIIGAGTTALTVDAAGGDAVATLTAEQAANLSRFINKLPAAAGEVSVDSLGYSVMFTSTVPGRVPGSYAVYQKIVDAFGVTTDYLKTTVDNLGNVVHTKIKF